MAIVIGVATARASDIEWAMKPGRGRLVVAALRTLAPEALAIERGPALIDQWRIERT